MTPCIKSSLLVACSGLILLSSSTTFAIGGNPCQNIAEACKQEGYVKNGPSGKRLIYDCVLPVVQGQKTVSYSPSDSEKTSCKDLIDKKMSQ